MTQGAERTRREGRRDGVSEAAIYRQENDQIALQLPGVRNPAGGDLVHQDRRQAGVQTFEHYG